MKVDIHLNKDNIYAKYNNKISLIDNSMLALERYLKKCSNNIFFNPDINMISNIKLSDIEKEYYLNYLNNIGYTNIFFKTIIDIINIDNTAYIFDFTDKTYLYFNEENHYIIKTKRNVDAIIVSILKLNRTYKNAIYISNNIKQEKLNKIELSSKITINYIKVNDDYYIYRA